MPINPSALTPSEPDEPTSEEIKDVAAHVNETQQREEQEQPKRSRRTKARMIAEAVIPANDAQVELKDVGTGAKIQRPWLVAAGMVRDGKAEWVDRTLKYAAMKFDQQKAEPAFKEPEVEQGETISQAEQVSNTASVPPDAEVGDEVSVGAEIYRVGHGGVLTSGPISVDGEVIKPKRRWLREIGAGPNGPWEAVDPIGAAPQHKPLPAKVETNGHSEQPPQPVALPEGVEIEQVSLRGWRIGTGVLEKIGLPDYSSLQVGPITASREVYDDGRRTTVEIGGRTASIPTAVVEIAREASDIVEYIARYQRGELVSFLESTGALKQPV